MKRSVIAAAAFLAAPILALAGCQASSGDNANRSGAQETAEVSSAIGAGETVNFAGNEPFWGGTVAGGKLTYNTPDNPDGTVLDVSRMAGLNGISWSGELDGSALTLAVTEMPCNDSMSDRAYPFTATLLLGSGDTRQGCAWTARRPYTGGE